MNGLCGARRLAGCLVVVGLVVGSCDAEPAGSPASDPLAGLQRHDWVVPAEIPVGYERLAAVVTSDGSTLQLFGDGEGPVVRVLNREHRRTLQAEDEEVLIGGATWYLSTHGPIDGVTLAELWRRIGDTTVLMSTDGLDDVLREFADRSQVIPTDEIEFAFLDADGPFSLAYSLETESGSVQLSVNELNGYFCHELAHPTGTKSRGGCPHTTSDREPVTFLVASQDASGTIVVAGLVEPDIARIDFETVDGTIVSVEPADESGQFSRSFWIVDGPASIVLNTFPAAVTIVNEDGTVTELNRSPLGNWQWTAPDPPTSRDDPG